MTEMNELTTILRQAGVVGAGGAGFPTYAKLSTGIDLLLANGAECEPLLNKDQILMANHPQLVLDGMKEVMKAIGAKKGIVAVKSKNSDSILALTKALSSSALPIEVFPLPDIYPAGDEVVLIYEVLKKVVSPGALPRTIGALVDNIETLVNVALAARGEPVTEKFVTLSGWVKQPVTVKLPLGTPAIEALEMAGGPLEKDFAIMMNGLMMGKMLTDLDAPITKTTSALLVLPSKHPLVINKQKKLATMLKLARSACVSCSHCSETCPRRLLGHPVQPHLIMRTVSYHSLPNNTSNEPVGSILESYENARYCVGCGACDLVCPMGLSPSSVSTYVKTFLPKKALPDSRKSGPRETRDGLKIPTSRLYWKLGINKLKNVHPTFREISQDAVKNVRLLLNQGIGMAAVPIVEIGQRVSRGEMVAEPPENQLGVALHSSIRGRVTSITAQEIVVEESRETA